jgi:hypothetical protein
MTPAIQPNFGRRRRPTKRRLRAACRSLSPMLLPPSPDLSAMLKRLPTRMMNTKQPWSNKALRREPSGKGSGRR